MSKIEINIVIDDGGVTPEMQLVFKALASLDMAAFLDPSLGTPLKTVTVKADQQIGRSTKEEAVKPEKVEATEVKTEVAPKEEPVKESKHTIEEVRELAVGKGTSHRAAIKAKLTELGAANLVKLDTKHFDAFVEFLNTLKD